MTLVDDRPTTATSPSSLTTVPAWHSYASELGRHHSHAFRSSPAVSRTVTVVAQGAHTPRWVRDYLNEELNKLMALPAGWDGSSAAEVTIEAVSETLTVLASLVNEATVAPQFFPLTDGGIQVEWHVGGNDIEIEVNGAGSAHVFASRSTGETVADVEIRTNSDDMPIRMVATFLNELSARLGLAHLSCDVCNSSRDSILRWRRSAHSG